MQKPTVSYSAENSIQVLEKSKKIIILIAPRFFGCWLLLAAGQLLLTKGLGVGTPAEMRPADIEMEEEGAPMAAAADGVPEVSPDRASALATFEATRVTRSEVFVFCCAAVPICQV